MTPEAQCRLAEARKAHARGWVLTPLRGKKPYRRNWQREQRCDLDTTEKWARRGNLGVRTGRISNLVVIDDDTPDLSAGRILGLPTTVTAITGSGKRHHYYCCPEGGLPCSVSRLADHVDVRGDGGQVVLPGAIHPYTGHPYTWAPGSSPDDLPLAEFPVHLVDRLRCPPRRQTPKSPQCLVDRAARGRYGSYGRTALEGELQRIRRTPPGSHARNTTLNLCAWRIGQLVGAGILELDRVTDALLEAALSTGLPERESRRTIASGLTAGMTNPVDLVLLEARRGLRRRHTRRTSR